MYREVVFLGTPLFGTVASYPLPPTAVFVMLISTSLWIFDSFLLPRDCNNRWCSRGRHLCGMLCFAAYDVRLPGPNYSQEITRGIYLDYVG